MNASTSNPPTPINVLVYALVAVLIVCAGLVAAAAIFKVASTELVVSVLGLAGIIVATLVGMLNAQIGALHTQQLETHAAVNGRLDQLVQQSNAAAFARGQSTTGIDPQSGRRVDPVPPAPG